MKQGKSLICYSLLAGVVMAPGCADAAIRVGNLSRTNAAARQEVEELRYKSTPEYKAEQAELAAQQAAAAVPTTLPVRVANKDLAEKIIEGDQSVGVDMAHLEKCSQIYPNGEFEWASPTAGTQAGMSKRCTSIVEMRAQNAKGEQLVLARVNVAAGDSVQCNISAWPENEWPNGSWLQDADGFEFPADAEPTVEDVVNVMNQEQKQNAGIKIAAAAVIGGLGGNVAGKSAPGSDALLGTNKEKIGSTVIGAIGGAAIAAGNAFGGKVAGDMILSTGVNAAAGAVVGNITASGDYVLRVEKCIINNQETTCLWGTIDETEALDEGSIALVSIDNIRDFKICKSEIVNNLEKYKCENADLTDAVVTDYKNRKRVTNNKIAFTLEDMFKDKFAAITDSYQKCLKDDNTIVVDAISQWPGCEDGKKYVVLESAKKVSKRTPAMLVDFKDSPFGYKENDWTNKLKADYKGPGVVGRGANGVATSLNAACASQSNTQTNQDSPRKECVEYFTPSGMSAGAGGLIDMDNKARLKGTLTGAGVGGALGAFSAYQGAQSDIQERWASEVRAYKDSLQKVWCITGERFLSHYNDDVFIPAVSE